VESLEVRVSIAKTRSLNVPGKAARELGVSHPAVSEVIADLEHALGVRLLDRSAQGVEPTIYGEALLKRSVAVFDELKQSIRDIEFLSDATTGEVRVGCMEAPWFTLVPDVILRFSKQYPRIKVQANSIDQNHIGDGSRADYPACSSSRMLCGGTETVSALP
jgi:DNA-binding transcriptional LysR family regulator